MRSRVTVGLLVAVLAFYCGFVAWKGLALVAEGGVVPVLLGLALIVSGVLGVALAWREVDFGRRAAVLGRALAAEGGLPVDDLPRRPSGRVDRAAADEVFRKRRAETEADPDNWRVWYRLAVAYDAAGDRTRARQAARHAITLFP
jgi:hypothetical protein